MRTRQLPEHYRLNLRIGDLVEVRSEPEILATLDENGELDALPFMPEMLHFCGQQFEVQRLAIKLCDTISSTGHHRMHNAVHLAGVRCGGQAHGGCQAGCLIYWKEAWLKRVEPVEREPVGRQLDSVGTACQEPEVTPPCTRAKLIAATSRSPLASSDSDTFSCQATELMRAAPERIRWWDVRQYVRDVRSGNASALPMIRSLCVMLFNKFQGFCRKFLPSFLWFHGAKRYPFIDGALQKTPHEILNLQPGERVRVKSKERIFQTLDTNSFNRGLFFDCEMLKFCGQERSVKDRVEKVIDEKTGKMLHMKNPCVILEDVTCSGDYHQYCPRGIYPYWREIWLERLEEERHDRPPAARP